MYLVFTSGIGTYSVEFGEQRDEKQGRNTTKRNRNEIKLALITTTASPFESNPMEGRTIHPTNHPSIHPMDGRTRPHAEMRGRI